MKSDREEEISYETLYIWTLKRKDTNELKKQKQTHTIGNKLMFTKVEREEEKIRSLGLIDIQCVGVRAHSVMSNFL